MYYETNPAGDPKGFFYSILLKNVMYCLRRLVVVVFCRVFHAKSYVCMCVCMSD